MNAHRAVLLAATLDVVAASALWSPLQGRLYPVEGGIVWSADGTASLIRLPRRPGRWRIL